MNLNEKPIREKYKEFYGKNVEQMELLIKDKRIPLTTKQIMERRLNSEQNDWNDNYFDTCDAIVYGEKGKFKIVKDCEILKKMNKKTKLTNKVIKITKKEYNEIKEKEFNKETPKEEIWNYLIGDLYEPYIKMMGYCPHFYISSHAKYLVRTCFVDRLGGRSSASGFTYLGDGSGRFVGVASEMLGMDDLKGRGYDE